MTRILYEWYNRIDMLWFLNPMNIVIVLLIIVVVVAIWRPAIVREWLDNLDFESILSKSFDFAVKRFGDLYGILRDVVDRIAVAVEKVLLGKIQDLLSDKAKELENSVELPKYVPSNQNE